MHMDRRTFLKALAATAVAPALPLPVEPVGPCITSPILHKAFRESMLHGTSAFRVYYDYGCKVPGYGLLSAVTA